MSAPIFVPVALKLDEAEALFVAARTIFDSAVMAGMAKEPQAAQLARAMVTLATAIDKATGEDDA